MNADALLPDYLTERADRVPFGQSPMLMVPFRQRLPECRVGERRYLAAADGIWAETRTPALHVRAQIAHCTLPFGPVQGFHRLEGGPLPGSMVNEIAELAITACPDEMAVLVIWNSDARAYELFSPRVESASPVHVRCELWKDLPNRHLAVDIHSHGLGVARFSSKDDESDRGILEPHLSVVLGRCLPGEIEATTRVCIGHDLVEISRKKLHSIGDGSGALSASAPA